MITYFNLVKSSFHRESNDYIVYFWHTYLGKFIKFNLFLIQYLNSGAGGLAGAFVHEKHAYTIKPT